MSLSLASLSTVASQTTNSPDLLDLQRAADTKVFESEKRRVVPLQGEETNTQHASQSISATLKIHADSHEPAGWELICFSLVTMLAAGLLLSFAFAGFRDVVTETMRFDSVELIRVFRAGL